MKNRSIAIFGIVTYLLSVYSSATNVNGESAVPTFIIVISGIATALFTILATIRIWRINKLISLLFIVTSSAFFILEIMTFVYSPVYGSQLIRTLNITKVIRLLTFFWALFLLWKTPHVFNRNHFK